MESCSVQWAAVSTGRMDWGGMKTCLVDVSTRGHESAVFNTFSRALARQLRSQIPAGGLKPCHRLHPQASRGCHPLRKAILPPDPITTPPATDFTQAPSQNTVSGMFFKTTSRRRFPHNFDTDWFPKWLLFHKINTRGEE